MENLLTSSVLSFVMSLASILAPSPSGFVVVERPPVADPPDRFSSAEATPAVAHHDTPRVTDILCAF